MYPYDPRNIWALVIASISTEPDVLTTALVQIHTYCRSIQDSHITLLTPLLCCYPAVHLRRQQHPNIQIKLRLIDSRSELLYLVEEVESVELLPH